MFLFTFLFFVVVLLFIYNVFITANQNNSLIDRAIENLVYFGILKILYIATLTNKI